jgi:hypothetical protein
MKKLLFISLLFVSVNSFSQKLSSDNSFNEDIIPLKTLSVNDYKTSKKGYNVDYVRKVVRRERIIGGTIFSTALVFFVRGAINTYRINKN